MLTQGQTTIRGKVEAKGRTIFMKHLKKTLYFILIFALVAGSTACAKNNSMSSSSVSEASIQSPESSAPTGEVNQELDFSKDEPITITFMTNDFVQAPINAKQPVLAELAKRTKVTIDYQVIPSADYASKLTLYMGSGKLPDLVNVVTPDNVSKYLADNVFAVLNNSVNAYGKSFLKELDTISGALKNLKDDNGNLYFLPRIDTCGLSTQMIINNAFLKKLGLPVPTTVDEFYTTMKAFKTLGSDVIPLGSGFATSLETPIFNAFGTSYNIRWYYNDGQYYYAPYMQQKQVKSALMLLAKMYSEGLIDKEYYAMSNDDALSKMQSGKLGAFNSWQDGIPAWTAGNKDNPDLDYLPVYPLSSSYGQGIMGRREPLAGYYAISSKSKYTDRIVKMYNYMCTDEGKELMNWGIKGETYTIDEKGEKAYTDIIMKHVEGPITGRRYLGIDHVNFPNIMDLNSWEKTVEDPLPSIMEKCKPYYIDSQPNLISTAEQSNRLAQIMTDIDKLVTTSYQQFICNQLNFNEDWDNFIKQMEQMKIQEAIDLKMKVFEKWKNR